MSPESSSRRLLVMAVIGGIVLVTLVGVGIYGLIVGPPDHDHHGTPTTIPPSESTPGGPSRPVSWEDLPALPNTGDPIRYASSVAEALLTWDTMSGLAPIDYARPVIVDADPSGYETPGLVSDVANFVPTDAVWQELRHYSTRQSITIDAAFIPDSWESIVASAAAGELREGTVAVTVEATRHRAGEWFDRPATSDHAITFTVFVACQPTFDRCHTLRLSLPDQPLS
ncbi:MAG: hypothetical protein ACK5PP_03350 [Acidimicrobiales bacterium]